jgi:hypothetical protein
VRNEAFVDIIERVSVLVSASRKIADCVVNRAIQMTDRLSGMPDPLVRWPLPIRLSEGFQEAPLPSAVSDLHTCLDCLLE